MALKLVKNVFSKPTLKKVFKRVFPNPVDHYKEQMMLFDFSDPKTQETWKTITDEQFGGLSSAELTRSTSGKALFRGQVTNRLPSGSDMNYSGICAIRSQPKVNRFNDVVPFDITLFDGLSIRFRGDGRTYVIGIQPDSIRLDDLHQFFLYTRGGPYWETVHMPFSKFILTNSGYLQDRQMDFPRIRTLGITLADHNNGPFSLEIDYIKARMFIYQPKFFNYQFDDR